MNQRITISQYIDFCFLSGIKPSKGSSLITFKRTLMSTPNQPKKNTPFEDCPKCGNTKRKLSICIFCSVEKFEEKHAKNKDAKKN